MQTAAIPIVIPDSFGGAEHRLFVYDNASLQFADRLRKMFKERRKWAKRAGVSCYRVYDADLPQFAVAIDIYCGSHCGVELTCAHIAEYAAPKYINETTAAFRLKDIVAIAALVFNVPEKYVFIKQRRRSKGGSQYALNTQESFTLFVDEWGSLLELDLAAYLDTGIFLDHRDTRKMLRDKSRGKTFLNLFAYTGVATVHAAAGGAVSTTTVDLSQTYLDWARRNMFENNYIGSQHKFVRSDVMHWMQEAAQNSRRFDLVFVDPPTFSNSKAMGKRTWDVQRNHVQLLRGVVELLSDGGEAIFSCNLRSFLPDYSELEKYGIVLRDISAQTIPHDFERNSKIHHTFVVTQRS